MSSQATNIRSDSYPFVIDFIGLSERQLGDMQDFAEAGAGSTGYAVKRRWVHQGDEVPLDLIQFHFSSPLVAAAFAELFGGRCRQPQRQTPKTIRFRRDE